MLPSILSVFNKLTESDNFELFVIFSAEPEFLKFVQGAIEWRKKWHYAEMERQRLNVIVTEKENELVAKEHQVFKLYNSTLLNRSFSDLNRGKFYSTV